MITIAFPSQLQGDTCFDDLLQFTILTNHYDSDEANNRIKPFERDISAS